MTTPSADETVFRLALTDLPAGDVDRLVDAGARDPSLVRVGLRLRYDIDALVVYAESGVATGVDVEAHDRANITPAAARALHAAGCADAGEQRRWRRTHKIGRGDRRFYFQAGVIHDDDIAALVAAKVTGKNAVDYVAQGVRSPADMLALRAAGVRPNVVGQYRRAGITSMEAMLALAARAVLPDAVNRFREHNIDSVDDMRALAKAKVYPHMVDGYQRAEVARIGDMIRLAQVGVNGWIAELFARDGVTGVDEMIAAWNSPNEPLRRLARSKHAPTESGWSAVNQFGRFGVTRRTHVADLWEADYDPATVEICGRDGVSVADLAAVAAAGVPREVALSAVSDGARSADEIITYARSAG